MNIYIFEHVPMEVGTFKMTYGPWLGSDKREDAVVPKLTERLGKKGAAAAKMGKAGKKAGAVKKGFLG